MTLELSARAALWFLPFVLPVCLWVAWSDLRAMKIPNSAVLSLVVIYLVIGLVALPLPDYGWRLTHLAVLLRVVVRMISPKTSGCTSRPSAPINSTQTLSVKI